MYIESQLPEGWVPDGAAVWILVREAGRGQWESLVPAFSLASQAESPEAATASVLELVDDYLLLCSREGKSFEDSYRSMWGAKSMGELAVDVLKQSVLPRVGRRFGWPPSQPPRRQYFREPLRRAVGGVLQG